MPNTLSLPGFWGLQNWSCWTSRVGCSSSSPLSPTLVKTSLSPGNTRLQTSIFIGCRSVFSAPSAPYQAVWTRLRRRQYHTWSLPTTSKCDNLIGLVWSEISSLRVKDNKFVSCAIDEVLTMRLEKARADGLDIKQIMHKVGISRESLDESDDPTFFQTDRPSSQFWNSGMLRGHRRLAMKHQVTIRHFTEQSMHNKVRFWLFVYGLGLWV